MSLYLDASVLLPLIVLEPGTAIVKSYLLREGLDHLVSEFAAAEVASGISRLVRMGILQAVDARERLSDFDAWAAAETRRVDVTGTDVRAAAALVRRFDLKLRAPDALHLIICLRLGATLVTLDRDLRSAARKLSIASLSLA